MASRVALAQRGEVAIWVDNTGKNKVEAEFVRLDGTSVVLLKADGKEVKVPMSRLSSESQQRARDAAKSMAKAPPKREVPSALPDSLDKFTVPPPTTFPSNATAQQFLEFVHAESKKNPVVIWDCLPEECQKEIDQLLVLASSKIQPQSLTVLRKTLESVFQLLKSKKEFILASEKLQPVLGPMNISDRYEPTLDIFYALLHPDLLSHDRWKKGDGREMVGKYLMNLHKKSELVSASMAKAGPLPGPLSILMNENLKMDIQQSSTTEATIKATFNDKPWELKLVAIDGKWIPEEFATNWKPALDKAKQQLSEMTPQISNEINQAVATTLGFIVTPQILLIQQTKTQSEFDAAINSVIQLVQQAVPKIELGN